MARQRTQIRRPKIAAYIGWRKWVPETMGRTKRIQMLRRWPAFLWDGIVWRKILLAELEGPHSLVEWCRFYGLLKIIMELLKVLVLACCRIVRLGWYRKPISSERDDKGVVCK